MLSLIVPNHKHSMCGFLSEGCCNHLVHVGDRGWVTTGPNHELMLLCQTFIFVFVLCFWVSYMVLTSLYTQYGQYK